MDRRQPIVFGVATLQEVELYRPDWNEGAISGGMTAQVWRGLNNNDMAPVITPTVTVDAVALSITGASGFSQTNRRKVLMSSTAGLVVGRPYYLESQDGQREMARFSHVVAGQYAETEYELAYDYTSGFVYGFRASWPMDTTFVSTPGNINLKGYLSRQGLYPDNIDFQSGLPYRVLWAYTLAGTARRHWTYFDVVRGPKQHGVLPDDLFELFPDLAHQEDRAHRGQKFQRFIDAGFRRVQFDLRARRQDPNQVADDMMDDLVRHATLMLIAETGRAPPSRDIEQYVRERAAIYKRDIDAVTTGPIMGVSQNTDGSMTPDPVPPIRFRS